MKLNGQSSVGHDGLYEYRHGCVELSEQSNILHIRIHPIQNASGIEVDSIELKGSDSSKVFHFDSEK